MIDIPHVPNNWVFGLECNFGDFGKCFCQEKQFLLSFGNDFVLGYRHESGSPGNGFPGLRHSLVFTGVTFPLNSLGKFMWD